MREILLHSTFFSVLLCLVAFECGIWLKKRFKFAIFNPLLISTLIVIATLLIFKIPFENFEKNSSHISFLLTPITVCLAVPLYEQIRLLKQNFIAIFAGISIGVLSGLSSIFLMSLMFELDHEFYVTLLPKSVTTPIGMGIAQSLNGIVTISVASIIVTGIFGNMCGEFLFKIFGIKKSIAKGIALGCASHAMGTAKAIQIGEIEGAMSSLSMAVTALFTVVGASIFANFI